MLGRQNCIGCGRVSPETNGDTTLTTSFGWRVRRGADEAGNSIVEWRCANCWQRWKTQSHHAPAPNDAPSLMPGTPHPAPSVAPAPPATPTRSPRGGDR